jgi:drug/metabolite transporter (DMT)-like permease
VYIYDWYSDIDPFLVTLTITMVTQTWYVIELNTSFKKTLWDCVENKFWGPIVFKSIFGAIASATELITLDYLPISLVEIVYNTSPVYATIISMTCIKEHVSRLDVINVVISFIGMVFITYGETSSSDQSSASQTTIAVMYVLLMLSPLFSGSGMHAVRKAKGLPAVTIYWYQNIIRISLLASYVLWIQPNPALGFTYYKNFDSLTWFLFLFMGVSLSLAQKTKSLAYRYAESSKVSGFQYIRVVIPSLYGLFIFKQPLNLG